MTLRVLLNAVDDAQLVRATDVQDNRQRQAEVLAGVDDAILDVVLSGN